MIRSEQGIECDIALSELENDSSGWKYICHNCYLSSMWRICGGPLKHGEYYFITADRVRSHLLDHRDYGHHVPDTLYSAIDSIANQEEREFIERILGE